VNIETMQRRLLKGEVAWYPINAATGKITVDDLYLTRPSDCVLEHSDTGLLVWSSQEHPPVVWGWWLVHTSGGLLIEDPIDGSLTEPNQALAQARTLLAEEAETQLSSTLADLRRRVEGGNPFWPAHAGSQASPSEVATDPWLTYATGDVDLRDDETEDIDVMGQLIINAFDGNGEAVQFEFIGQVLGDGQDRSAAYKHQDGRFLLVDCELEDVFWFEDADALMDVLNDDDDLGAHVARTLGRKRLIHV